MRVRTNVPLDVINDTLIGDENRSDYRPVPASDRGDKYGDRGMLGSYEPNDGESWKNPAGVMFMGGYGATREDLERGYVEPEITQAPAYSRSNYQDRSTLPKVSDVTPGNVEMMESEWEFRRRNRESRGFLTRPRIPTER